VPQPIVEVGVLPPPVDEIISDQPDDGGDGGDSVSTPLTPPVFSDEDRVDIIIPESPTAQPVAASFADLVLGNVPISVARSNNELPTPAALEYISTNVMRPSENSFS